VLNVLLANCLKNQAAFVSSPTRPPPVSPFPLPLPPSFFSMRRDPSDRIRYIDVNEDSEMEKLTQKSYVTRQEPAVMTVRFTMRQASLAIVLLTATIVTLTWLFTFAEFSMTASSASAAVSAWMQAAAVNWKGAAAAPVVSACTPTLGLPPIRTRTELGELLQSQAHIKIGVELGVQRGVGAKMLLDKWNACDKYILVDLWAAGRSSTTMATLPMCPMQSKKTLCRRPRDCCNPTPTLLARWSSSG
jgi:hypothetical protein